MQHLFFNLLLIFLTFMCASCNSNHPESHSTGIVFDCDPGTDDAVALKLMSVYGPQPDWCISTFGNMPWTYTQKNLNILARMYGFKSQIAVGAKAPYDGHTVSCGDFHGTDGLADRSESLFSELGMTQADLDANKSMAELAEYICSKKDITYIATGPLATLSHLLTDHPETVKHIKRVYIMGGGVKRFNKDGNKEYNFAGDGIAVKRVFDSPLDITLFPLDITEVYAFIAKEKIESVDFSNASEQKTFIQYNCKSYMTRGVIGAVLHDCLPVLYLQQPDKFTIEDMQIAADETGHIEPSAAGRPVHVAVSCSEDLLFKAIKEAVEK